MTQYNEAPISDLLDENLLQLNDEALDALQRELSVLVAQPGALTRALGDESVALASKAPASRKPRTKKVDVSHLL